MRVGTFSITPSGEDSKGKPGLYRAEYSTTTHNYKDGRGYAKNKTLKARSACFSAFRCLSIGRAVKKDRRTDIIGSYDVMRANAVRTKVFNYYFTRLRL